MSSWISFKRQKFKISHGNCNAHLHHFNLSFTFSLTSVKRSIVLEKKKKKKDNCS